MNYSKEDLKKINDEIVGYNPVCLKNLDVEYLYYIYGSLNNEKILYKLGLLNIFNYYNNDLLKKRYNIYPKDIGLTNFSVKNRANYKK